MNKISTSTIVFVSVMSISLAVGVIGFIGMVNERDDKISSLDNRVSNLEKQLAIDEINVCQNSLEKALNGSHCDHSSILQACKLAQKEKTAGKITIDQTYMTMTPDTNSTIKLLSWKSCFQDFTMKKEVCTTG